MIKLFKYNNLPKITLKISNISLNHPQKNKQNNTKNMNIKHNYY